METFRPVKRPRLADPGAVLAFGQRWIFHSAYIEHDALGLRRNDAVRRTRLSELTCGYCLPG